MVMVFCRNGKGLCLIVKKLKQKTFGGGNTSYSDIMGHCASLHGPDILVESHDLIKEGEIQNN